MEFKPNEITDAQAKEVVNKFRTYNEGVILSKPGSIYTTRSKSAISSKWSDIINPDHCSMGNIIDKMKKLYRDIRNNPEDNVINSIVGDTTIAFNHETERGVKIPFTFTDLYILCREAVKYRQETEEYKAEVRQLEKDMEFVRNNRSKDTLLAEAEARIAASKAKLGLESTQASSSATEVEEPA